MKSEREVVCHITGKIICGSVQFCTECGKPELLGANYCSYCGMPMSHPATCSCSLCLHETEPVPPKKGDACTSGRFDAQKESLSNLPREEKKPKTRVEPIDIEKLYQQIKLGSQTFEMEKIEDGAALKYILSTKAKDVDSLYAPNPSTSPNDNWQNRKCFLREWSFLNGEQVIAENTKSSRTNGGTQSPNPEILFGVMKEMFVYDSYHLQTFAKQDLASTSLLMEWRGEEGKNFVTKDIFRLFFRSEGEKILISEWSFRC